MSMYKGHNNFISILEESAIPLEEHKSPSIPLEKLHTLPHASSHLSALKLLRYKKNLRVVDKNYAFRHFSQLM